jgi:hypothetical protein
MFPIVIYRFSPSWSGGSMPPQVLCTDARISKDVCWRPEILCPSGQRAESLLPKFELKDRNLNVQELLRILAEIRDQVAHVSGNSGQIVVELRISE